MKGEQNKQNFEKQLEGRNSIKSKYITMKILNEIWKDIISIK
jgi:hypothetical protein